MGEHASPSLSSKKSSHSLVDLRSIQNDNWMFVYFFDIVIFVRVFFNQNYIRLIETNRFDFLQAGECQMTPGSEDLIDTMRVIYK